MMQQQKASSVLTFPFHDELLRHRLFAQDVYAQLLEQNKKDKLNLYAPLPQVNWLQPVAYCQLEYKELPNGVIVGGLQTIAQKYPALVKKYVTDEYWYQYWNLEKYSALIEGYYNTSLVVIVPPNTTIIEPLDIANFCVRQTEISVKKIVIIVQDNSKIMIENSSNCVAPTVQTLDCFVGPYAHVTISSLVKSQKSFISSTRAHVQKNAQFLYKPFIADTSYYRNTIALYLHGHHADAQVTGLYLPQNNHTVVLNTLQQHAASDSTSSVLLKGILQDDARAIYQGNIFIEKHAKNTVASQQNKNLMLSKHARVWSVPGLEVLNNDVQCMHGSAIGQLDAEQLWYLCTRGLSQEQARQILLHAFCADVCDDWLVAKGL